MTSDIRLYPVIMCGGSGTRLWPASRPSRPKQFLPLVGETSLFADTVLRLAPTAMLARFVVVAGERHAGAILSELARLGVEADVLLEPEARDSGPAIAAAASWIAARDPEGVAVVLASDHHIPDATVFRECAELSAQIGARHGRIVTLGIKPSSASSAYGYIRPGAQLEGAVRELEAFVEKPTAQVAEGYLQAGYLWNSGNFIAPARILVQELERLAPDVLAGAAAGVREATSQGGTILLGPSFRSARKMSFDFAVMERTDKAAVLPVEIAWSDLGAWDAVHQARPTDDDGNSMRGAVVHSGCRDTLVEAAPGMVVAVRNLSGIAVVAEADAVLVMPLNHSQGVKELVDGLKAQGAPQVDVARTEFQDLASAADDLRGWLFGSALPTWYTYGFDHARGGAVEQLTALVGADDAPRRARVQPRQAHSFAVAARLGWQGPSASAIRMALDAMNRIYCRSDGQVVALAGADGTVLDTTTRLYDQAFVLLALASATDLQPDAEEQALALLTAIEATYASPTGGFCETGGLYLSNPLMHLFEASLAWIGAGTSPRWRSLAANLADLALTRLIDSVTGSISEHYGSNWQPVQGADGEHLEPGHQFEWAWLLVRWSRIAASTDALAAARRLYASGAAGLDAARQVMVDGTDRKGAMVVRTARLWPQTEWLKAALILAEEAASDMDRARLVSDALRAAAAVRRYCPDTLRGLWHDTLDTRGQFQPGPSPASTLYHLVEAIGQLIATAGTAGKEAWAS